MADWTRDLDELYDKIKEEITDINKKLRTAGGKLSMSDIECIDKLTHTAKSISAVIAMEDGYSEDYSCAYPFPPYYYDGGQSMNNGGSSMRRGRSGARGRARNANRDSMGRYTNDYSGSIEEMEKSIRMSMPSMPEHLRREAEDLLRKIELDM